jgi:hypothetical protein
MPVKLLVVVLWCRWNKYLPLVACDFCKLLALLLLQVSMIAIVIMIICCYFITLHYITYA